MQAQAQTLVRQLALHAWAVVVAAVVLEASFRLALLATGAQLGARTQATLLALQATAQVLAASVLLAFAALGRARNAWLRVAAPIGVMLASLLAFSPVASSLTEGDWISAQPYAGALRWAIMILGAVTTTALLWCALGSWLQRRPHAHRALLWVLGVAAIGTVVINARVYSGQYPEGHLAIAGLGCLMMQLAFSEGLRHGTSSRPRVARIARAGAAPLAALTVLALFFLLPPVPAVSSEILLASHRLAPSLGWFGSARVPQLSDELRRLDPREAKRDAPPEPSAWTIPSDWNIVLIVVDALRADAVPPGVDDRPVKRFSRKDAPTLTALAERSYRFRRAYTAATYTHLAMPAMFWSRRPFEQRAGVPLGVLMAETGRASFAVINDYFAQPIDDDMLELQSGFAEVRTYDEHAQNEQRSLINESLDKFQRSPFFGWFHYYGVHSPGWNGKKLKGKKSWPDNYHLGLEWVDGEIAWLLRKLKALGIEQRTVVVVTADHGEGLMDTGHMYHGPVAYEEVVRVPLLIYIPGKSGGLIESTVGTIDLVPTLVDLMGARKRSSHAGRSLVPAMLGKQSLEPTPYFFMSGTQRQVGVVRGSDKHLYDRPAGLHMHFDLAQDPLEDRNAFDPTKHGSFVSLLVRQYPSLLRGDLDTGEAQALLNQRLEEIDVARPPASLPFLLRTIRASPTASRLQWAREVFERAASDDVRLSVLTELGNESLATFARPIRWHLEALGDHERASRFVDALADLAVPSFETRFVTKRFVRAVREGPAQWLPWLRLTAHWPRKGKHVRPLTALTAQLSAAGAQADEVSLRLLLKALANADLRDNAPVTVALEQWLSHPNPIVRADATRAFGRTGSLRAREELEARLKDGDLVIRLAALEGLSLLLGPNVAAYLERSAKQKDTEATVLRLAVALKGKRAKRLVRKLATDAKNQFVRANARNALEQSTRAL